jgi:hypothetical protein
LDTGFFVGPAAGWLAAGTGGIRSSWLALAPLADLTGENAIAEKTIVEKVIVEKAIVGKASPPADAAFRTRTVPIDVQRNMMTLLPQSL